MFRAFVYVTALIFVLCFCCIPSWTVAAVFLGMAGQQPKGESGRPPANQGSPPAPQADFSWQRPKDEKKQERPFFGKPPPAPQRPPRLSWKQQRELAKEREQAEAEVRNLEKKRLHIKHQLEQLERDLDAAIQVARQNQDGHIERIIIRLGLQSPLRFNGQPPLSLPEELVDMRAIQRKLEQGSLAIAGVKPGDAADYIDNLHAYVIWHGRNAPKGAYLDFSAVERELGELRLWESRLVARKARGELYTPSSQAQYLFWQEQRIDTERKLGQAKERLMLLQ